MNYNELYIGGSMERAAANDAVAELPSVDNREQKY